MNAGASQHRLRLVGFDITDEMANWQRQQQAKNEVVKENRLSAHGTLSPDDPALKLAAQVRSELQGPVLSPERRERILKIANKLGMRPFEASLVIALEQDHARLAKPASNAAPSPLAPGSAGGSNVPQSPKYPVGLAARATTLPTPPSPENIAERTAHIVEHLADEAPIMAWRWLLAAASAILLAAVLIRIIAL